MPAGSRRDALTSAINGILQQDFRVRILPFDSPSTGEPISQFDAQIAAIARTHGAAVATRNIRDFKGCGIELIDPWNRE